MEHFLPNAINMQQKMLFMYLKVSILLNVKLESKPALITRMEAKAAQKRGEQMKAGFDTSLSSLGFREFSGLSHPGSCLPFSDGLFPWLFFLAGAEQSALSTQNLIKNLS